MPRINKPKIKKIKRKPTAVKVAKKTFKKPILALVKPKNTFAYYECMCHQTKQGLKGKKITKACQECKTGALAINTKMSAKKAQAVKKIKQGYQQLGKGLDEFIKSK